LVQHQSGFFALSRVREASLLLIGIYRSIGCSLTIHRVESALLAETASWRTVPLTTIEFLIASNMNFTLVEKRALKYGITRQVKDLAIP
jgi:hypothetical protein